MSSPIVPKLPRIFISYSRKDKDFALNLRDSLLSFRDDNEPWIDIIDIHLGEKFLDEIYQSIELSKAILFILSPDSINSYYCHLEISHAREFRKNILPIVCRKTEDSDFKCKFIGKSGVEKCEIEECNIKEDDPEKCTKYDNWKTIKAINWLFMDDDNKHLAQLMKLNKVLNTDRDFVQKNIDLIYQVQFWEKAERSNDALLKGRMLEKATYFEQVSIEQHKELAPIVVQFLDISRSQQKQEKLHNLRIRQRLVMGFLIVGIVASILAVFAIYNKIQAGAAEFRNGIAKADLQFNSVSFSGWQMAAMMYCRTLQGLDIQKIEAINLDNDAQNLIPLQDCPVNVGLYISETDIKNVYGKLGGSCLFIKNYKCAEEAFTTILQHPANLPDNILVGFRNNLILTHILRAQNKPKEEKLKLLNNIEEEIAEFRNRYGQSHVCVIARMEALSLFVREDWMATLVIISRLEEVNKQNKYPICDSSQREEITFLKAASLQKQGVGDCSRIWTVWTDYDQLAEPISEQMTRPPLGFDDRHMQAEAMKSQLKHICFNTDN